MTRYSLHHVLDPERVLSEAVRVVQPGGRVVVADLVLPPKEGRAYDRVERLRDPSHVRVLSNWELGDLMVRAGLREIFWGGYRFELELNALLQGSFPDPADAGQVRRLFEEDVGVNRLGIDVHRRDGDVRVAYPIVIVSGRQPDSAMESSLK